MDYFTLKALHIISIFGLVVSFGVLVAGCLMEGKNKLKKWGFILHGVSWLAVIGTASALVEVMNLHSNFPAWGTAKTLAWVLLGAEAFFIKIRPKLIAVHFSLVFILCSVAVVLAVYKPNF